MKKIVYSSKTQHFSWDFVRRASRQYSRNNTIDELVNSSVGQYLISKSSVLNTIMLIDDGDPNTWEVFYKHDDDLMYSDDLNGDLSWPIGFIKKDRWHVWIQETAIASANFQVYRDRLEKIILDHMVKVPKDPVKKMQMLNRADSDIGFDPDEFA